MNNNEFRQRSPVTHAVTESVLTQTLLTMYFKRFQETPK